MAHTEITVSGRGMEITDSIRDYIENKIQKYSQIYEKFVTRIEVECTERAASRGVEKDFGIEISAYLPKAIARVEKKGEDLYALVDKSADVLIRKIKRYKDQLRKWEGQEEWKINDYPNVKEEEDFQSYNPEISKTTEMEDTKPMTPQEAVERMDLLGYDFFLFKDMLTKKPSVVYKRQKGSYGLVRIPR
jgi:putative sigma-54 modulation protein